MVRNRLACGVALMVVAGAAVGAGAQDSVPMTPLRKGGEGVQPETAPAKPSTSEKSSKPAAEKPKLYDEAADAKVQIAAAVAKAKKNNRRVLVQWGGNWCHWCYKLEDTFQKNAEVRKKLTYEYDVVHVDIGNSPDHPNVAMAMAMGADFKSKGVPYLTVLDGDGKVIANQDTGSLEDGEAHDPAKVLAFLSKHQAEYPQASGLLGAGLAKAKAENKLVFLHFGAPWCGYCHKLETWMARPEVAAVLGKDFIDVKIDQDRTVGAGEVMAKFNPAAKRSGIPWFAFVDGNGKVVADSNGAKGNVGFPTSSDEVEHFGRMLTKAKRAMSDSEIAGLVESLTVKPKGKA